MSFLPSPAKTDIFAPACLFDRRTRRRFALTPLFNRVLRTSPLLVSLAIARRSSPSPPLAAARTTRAPRLLVDGP